MIDAIKTHLAHRIVRYYFARGLVWPSDADTALQFLTTELAEAQELLLARKAEWVRNNPKDKPEFNKTKLGEELGDIIMMAMVAGLVEGVDPLACLEAKMRRKISE